MWNRKPGYACTPKVPPMNILMMTNVYTPLVGGVSRSIQAFTAEFRRRGHDVLVVAPRFGKGTPQEEGVIRIPAVPNVYRQRYAWPLPIPGFVYQTIREFQPDVIHSHHPFLLGKVGQRESVLWDLPLVYTHHTRYREYMQIAGMSKWVTELLWSVTLAYCELCDVLVAPSESIRSMVAEAGVDREIRVIPTGVDFERFRQGDGARGRQQLGIPADAFVVGSVSRLDPEKNWDFLAPTVAEYLRKNAGTHFLVVGSGESAEMIRRTCMEAGVGERLHMPGALDGQKLVDAYHALDVFLFASYTETQGMVITEAMAAGKPVIALDASGVQDVVVDCRNGRLLPEADAEAYRAAIQQMRDLPEEKFRQISQAAQQTAHEFSLTRCADRVLEVYQTAIEKRHRMREAPGGDWPSPLRFLRYQWRAWSTLIESVSQSLSRSQNETHQETD